MRIKKFIASNLQEGKVKVAKELGDDAVILSTRTMKKTDESGEELIEIVAAIDDSPMKEFRKNTNKQAEIPSASNYEDETQINKFIRTASHIYEEIGTIKDAVANLSDFVKYKYSGALNNINKNIYQELIKSDFSEEFALKITGILSSKEKKYVNTKEAINDALEMITDKIKIVNPLKKQSKPQIITFVGTNGSGKTTALVKLAIISKLALESNVSVISADTQKVGGFEQLQTFASIANIPFEAMYNLNDIYKSISEKLDKNFIFIDTTGLSQNNQEGMNELRSLINTIKPDQNFLVISAGTSLSTFNQIIRKFEQTNPSALILTKLDEAATIGNVVSALLEKPIPIAYFSAGTKIPDDIEPFTKELIGKMIFPEYYK